LRPVDVDVVPFVRACGHPLELRLASASHVPRCATTSRTVQSGIALVAGLEALLGRQGSNEVDDLVPPTPFRLDLRGVGWSGGGATPGSAGG
jgi:hypothetical protein